MAERKPRPLTEKQEAFVRAYLTNGRNGAAAYRAAYKSKASSAAATKEAGKLLKDPRIAPLLAAVVERAAERTALNVARVLDELALVGLSDVGDVLDFSGESLKLRPPNEIPESARRVLSSVKVKRYFEGHGDDAREVEVTEFKLWDKLAALEKIGKHLGMFPNRQEHSGPNGGPIPHEHAVLSPAAFGAFARDVLAAGGPDLSANGRSQSLRAPGSH